MQSLKSKIFAGGILAGLISLILAIINVYSTNHGVEALATVYENRVIPSSALKEMDRHLKEIRYRIAGVALGQLPGAGSVITLKEAQAEIPALWAVYLEKTRDYPLDAEGNEQIDIINKRLDLLTPFFSKLSGAFINEDKKLLNDLLENEWPPLHAGLLKPITKLVNFQEASIKTTYEKSRADGKKRVFFGLGVFGVGMLILLIGINMLSSNIHRGVRALKDTLHKVAQGDLTAVVPFKRKDELGEMGQSLENTTSNLREIIGILKNSANEASNASTNLSDQLAQVSSRGELSNDRVKHVAAAMEEISMANSEISCSATDTAAAVRRNETYAREGNENMGKNRASMEKVVKTTQNSVDIVRNLNNSIQKIGQITTVIREIADQTNLLALNAAIEAARAGEQGRGFAVVADEVRKLAERTSSSTSEISGVVEAIRAETEAAVASMSEVEREVQESANFNHLTGEALKQIVAAANQVTGLVGHIAESTKEQTSATKKITHNMEEIAELSGENATNIHRVSQSVEGMSNIATELKKIVNRFKV